MVGKFEKIAKKQVGPHMQKADMPGAPLVSMHEVHNYFV